MASDPPVPLSKTLTAPGEDPTPAEHTVDPYSPTLGSDAIPGGEVPRGSFLGRYVVVGQLGEGGMGVVYKAYDPVLDRAVAVKLLRPSTFNEDDADEARKRLLREGRAMARLSHPNVVAVHDVGTHDGQVFVAMELVDGETLRSWLGRPREARELVAMFIQAARGLAAAHDAGLVHRDFKPENVLVGKDDRARVVDFGIAHGGAKIAVSPEETALVPASRRAKPFEIPLTVAGAIMGTPRYMAPEQFQGERTDLRADQFSFAVALFEALYGEPPFEISTLAALRESVTSGKIRPVRMVPGVPARLHPVLLRALSPRPDDRFPSMHAVIEALERDPASARRRRLAAGAAAVVTAAAVTFGVHSWRARVNVCASAADAATRVWNPDAERTLRAAFAAPGKAYLETVATTVVGAIAGQARKVATGLDETCRAERVERALGPDQAEARRECLAGRASELKALAERIETGGSEALESAVFLAGGLSSVEACKDPRRSALLGSLPVDPARRDAVRKIRKDLEEESDRSILGHYEQAAGLARTAVAEAKAIAYKPLEAEAEHRLGVEERRLDRKASAESTLKQALLDADAAHDDVLRVEIATELVYLCGVATAKAEQGLEWAGVARAVLDRLGGDDQLEAALLNHLGTIQWRLARYDEAGATFDRAIELRRRTNDREELAAALNNKALVLWDEGKRKEALGALVQADKIFAQLFGELHPTFAAVLENEGNVWIELERPDLALPIHQRVQQIRAQSSAPEDPQLGTGLLSIGETLAAMGDLEGADRSLREGALFADKVDWNADAVGGLARAIGTNERRRGRWRESEEALGRARAAFLKGYGPSHPETARTLARIAALELDTGRADDAARDADDARSVLQAVPNGDKGPLAEAVELGAEAHAARGDRRAAVDDYERALALLALGRADNPVAFAIARMRLDALKLGSAQTREEVASHARDCIAGVSAMTSVGARFARAYAGAVRARAAVLAGERGAAGELRQASAELAQVDYVNRNAAREVAAWVSEGPP